MRRKTILALPAIGLVACHRESAPELERTVIVAVMDGVPLEDSLGEGPSSLDGSLPSQLMPRLWSEMVPAGVRATQDWNSGATITIPAHAAMISGRSEALAEYPATLTPGLYRPTRPAWWEVLNATETLEPGQSTLATNGVTLDALSWSLWPENGEKDAATWERTDETGLSDASDVDLAVAMEELLDEQLVRSLLVNFHMVDRIAHRHPDVATVKDALALQDAALSDLWAAVQENPSFADRTWLILVADHGRHDHADTDPPWQDHGCDCAGCRHVPFLMLGPSVEGGSTTDEVLLLEDIGATAAALLGIPLPWSEGFVRDDLMQTPLGVSSRLGIADLARVTGHQAAVEFLPNPAHRSRLVLDGVTVSDPEAVLVEAPVLSVDDRGAWTCWRELILHSDADSPWVPRCLASTDGITWQDLGSPVEEVGLFWEAALVPDGVGSVYALFANDPVVSESIVPLDLAHATGGTWSHLPTMSETSFPVSVSSATLGSTTVLAMGAARDREMARHNRDIWT